MRFIALVSTALLFAALVGPVRGAIPPVAADAGAVIQLFSNGGTLLGVMDGHGWMERYEPDGSLRGTYRGRAYGGRWSVEGNRLCTVTDGTRQCGTIASQFAHVRGDFSWHSLLLNTQASSAMPVLYRTGGPGQRRDAVTGLTGTVERVWVDGFTFSAEGRFHSWVQTGRPHGLRASEMVTVHGMTDGIVLDATEVRRADATQRR